MAANYIEANENLGKNDLKMRIKISKKETKESRLWLKHIITYDEQLDETRRILIQETIELQNIFAAILKKLDHQPPISNLENIFLFLEFIISTFLEFIISIYYFVFLEFIFLSIYSFISFAYSLATSLASSPKFSLFPA